MFSGRTNSRGPKCIETIPIRRLNRVLYFLCKASKRREEQAQHFAGKTTATEQEYQEISIKQYGKDVGTENATVSTCAANP